MKSLNLPLYCFETPLPALSVYLSPPPVPRSPCNSSLLRYNQVFFMLFCKVPCKSVPRSSSASLAFAFSPPFHSLSSAIFPMSGLEEMGRRLEGAVIYGLQRLTVRGFMYRPVPSANLIHYFIHSGHYFRGRRTKVVTTDSIFLHYGELTSFCAWKRQRISRSFDLCHVISDF